MAAVEIRTKTSKKSKKSPKRARLKPGLIMALAVAFGFFASVRGVMQGAQDQFASAVNYITPLWKLSIGHVAIDFLLWALALAFLLLISRLDIVLKVRAAIFYVISTLVFWGLLSYIMS